MIIIPYSSKSIYKHHRQQSPKKFRKGSFKTVPLSHTNYSGKKFKKLHKQGSGAKAIVGKKKKSGKWGIQSILVPKKKKKKTQ